MKQFVKIVLTSLLFSTPYVIFSSHKNTNPLVDLLENPIVTGVAGLFNQSIQTAIQATTLALKHTLPNQTDNNPSNNSLQNFSTDYDSDDDSSQASFSGYPEDEEEYDDTYVDTFFPHQKKLQKALKADPSNVQKKLNDSLAQYFSNKEIVKTATQHKIKHIFKLIEDSKKQNQLTLASEIANLYNIPQTSELEKFLQIQQHKHEEFETQFQKKNNKATLKLVKSILEAHNTYQTEKKEIDTWHTKKLETSFKKAMIRAENSKNINSVATRKVDCTTLNKILECKTSNTFQSYLLENKSEITTNIKTYEEKQKIVATLIDLIKKSTEQLQNPKKQDALKK